MKKFKPCERCFGSGLEPSQKLIGATMRADRVAADKTMAEVARRVGVTASCLSLLEAGKRRWTLTFLNRVRKIIGAT
jgi:transcriptional regulator with XRE-family HTH domain